MVRKISVSIHAASKIDNTIELKDNITILSKHDIFTIPISATITKQELFESDNGKKKQNPKVKEQLLDSSTIQKVKPQEKNKEELLTKKPWSDYKYLR